LLIVIPNISFVFADSHSKTVDDEELTLETTAYLSHYKQLNENIFLSTIVELTNNKGLDENIYLETLVSLGEFNLDVLMSYTPNDYPQLTTKNYTYDCAVYDLDLEEFIPYCVVLIKFDEVQITQKHCDEFGEFIFWIIVNTMGNHHFSFVIYASDETESFTQYIGTVFKDVYFENYGGGGQGGGGGGGWIPTPPTDISVWINGLVAYLPAIIIIAIFMFFGSLLAGTIGILGGLIAGIFVDVSVAFLPQYILFFIILVGILIGIYKFKKPSNGGGSA
jgi:hypothetical protein